MRYFIGLVCVLALSVMGCSETSGTGGSGGDGGNGGDGGTGGVVSCMDNVCPCSEAGIRAAIEAGGEDPYTFACNGPQTVVTGAEIVIDNDVILDGEGNLTVDGDESHRVFSVPLGVTAALRGLTVTGGRLVAAMVGDIESGAGILNEGRLLLVDTTVRDNSAEHLDECHHTGGLDSCVAYGGGIHNHCAPGTQGGQLTLQSSTVSGNYADWLGGAIASDGHCASVLLQNSTVSGNSAGDAPEGISSTGTVTIVSSTISDRLSAVVSPATITNSLVDGDCEAETTSSGYNIESPGDTCGFDHGTDLVNITKGQLDLGDLANNGGPTMTHALGADSVALDRIPEVDCEVEADQRGQPRPETGGTMCDVGSFELQPEDL